jgi:hypothetical protein
MTYRLYSEFSAARKPYDSTHPDRRNTPFFRQNPPSDEGHVTHTINPEVKAYFTTLLVARLYSIEWLDDRWRMNWKESGRSGHGLIDLLSESCVKRLRENGETLSHNYADAPSQLRPLKIVSEWTTLPNGPEWVETSPALHWMIETGSVCTKFCVYQTYEYFRHWTVSCIISV